MALGGERDVGRLQVTMDDAAIVRSLQGVGDLPRDRQRVTNGERTGCQPIGEGTSLHQLHDQELRTLLIFQTIERCDVWMGQTREDLRLAAKPRDAFGIGNRRRWERLDGNVAAEARVAGAIYLTHPARAKRRDDLVRTEAMSGWQRRHGVDDTRAPARSGRLLHFMTIRCVTRPFSIGRSENTGLPRISEVMNGSPVNTISKIFGARPAALTSK